MKQDNPLFFRLTQYFLLLLAIITSHYHSTNGSLISSSEVQFCQRTTSSFDPALDTGDSCSKKFLVALAVRNGKGNSGSIYADIKYVNNKTVAGSILKREQLRKPFRISVTKSEVLIHYPLRYLYSVNNQPYERYHSVTNHFLGFNYCNPSRCGSLVGYCCYSIMDEKLSKAWHYKRGVGYKVGHYHSHRYSQAICMGLDALNYNVFEIMEPYLSYKINVTVQQLDYQERSISGQEEHNVWKTVGYAEIGPETIGQNTNQNQVGKTSGPQIKAVWLGDFKMTTSLANFNSKYLLIPDWRASLNVEETRQHEQVVGGSKEWLVIDRHHFEKSGLKCNKIGVNGGAFVGQTNRCYQKQRSCFQVTPRKFFVKAKAYTDRKLKTEYFLPFYGDFLGPFLADEKFTDTSDVVQLQDFQLIYRSADVHNSLITLTFTAETISFVENRSQGRIVEALVNDFVALVGTGLLSVIVQNTGIVTADYAVSIDSCSEGILRVSERLKTINPRQQVTFEFELSTSLNVAYNHSCTIELTDRDGSLLDIKEIKFKTEEGCIYCPAGVCSCSCDAAPGNSEDGEEARDCKDDGYINPYWVPKIIIVEPCYHCWFTDSLTHPVPATFVTVILLLSLGMSKMLLVNCCCKTRDGRTIDVVGIMLGTTSMEHTRKKARSTTMQFLLGVCFFVYLPLLPLMIVFCNWRRRVLAKKRLKKKAQRKKKRLLQRKQAALKATKGLMILGEDEEITVDDAIKAFDKAGPGPTILVVSTSSDSEEQNFDYTSSSEEDIVVNIFGEEMVDEFDPKQKKKKKEKSKKSKR